MTVGRRLVDGAVHALETTDSTQSVLGRLAVEGAAEGTVVVAGHQSAGRGRRGHAWWDVPGKSLLMSVLLRPPVPINLTAQLSLVAGLAVADALDEVAGVSARIRWPNDVLVDGRKVSGVLAEALAGPDGRARHVLLGIGINVGQAEFPEDLRGRATSLRLATGRDHEPGRLRAAVLEALDRRYREWLVGGFGTLRDEWRRRAASLGDRVRTPGGTDGVAVDVAEDGALLVDAGTGALVRMVAGVPEG
jgi:BirA family biotin operon repressor/biotin-[acetyl-CoA-carboxylase] ligase